MFSRSSWLHLRIPFSYFLLPVFLFTLSVSPNLSGARLFWTFFIIHVLLYPASNGFNSYFDKDEKSIGGLKNPPPVSRGLYFLSLAFDVVAIALGLLFVNLTFSIMLFVYGLASKAYSHPSIRLKKYPVSGWLTTGFFQGFFTVMMCHTGINDFALSHTLNDKVIWAGVLASAMLLGNYPMTQVYQHEEDSARGDQTISLKLGIKGTFYFVAVVFAFVFSGFVLYFSQYMDIMYAYYLMVAFIPILIFFGYWLLMVLRDTANADYKHAMWLNFISATCLNLFFIYLFIDSTHILDALQT